MGNELVKKNEVLKQAQEGIAALLSEKAKALPKGFNKTRFLQNCMAVMMDVKDIEKCTLNSIARCMIKAAFLDLDFFNKECYAIVYNKNVGTQERAVWEKDLQFQTDYKGERKLALKYSVKKTEDVYADVVRKGDYLDYKVINGKKTLDFTPIILSDEEIIGAFAIVVYSDGKMAYEIMTKKEIELSRQNWSKAPDSKAWKNTPGEMYKKTVLRRLCKGIDLQFANTEQIEAFEDASGSEVKDTIDITVPNAFAERLASENQKSLPSSKKTKNSSPEQSEPQQDIFEKSPSEVKEDSEGRIIE